MTHWPNRWSRRTSLSLLISICLIPLAVLFSVPAGASKSSSASSRLVKAAIASANQQGSVRVTVHFFSDGKTGEVVQDSAGQSGVQTVAIGTERVSVVLVNGVAYVTGNRQGLTSYMGFPAAIATALANHWVSFRSTDSGYQELVAGVTLRSALKEVTPAGKLARGKPEKIDGHQTLSISGRGTTGQGRTTLFIATTGKRLPVEAAASSGTGKSASGEVVTFSRWGEKVNTPTPTSSTPVSEIESGSSSSG